MSYDKLFNQSESPVTIFTTELYLTVIFYLSCVLLELDPDGLLRCSEPVGWLRFQLPIPGFSLHSSCKCGSEQHCTVNPHLTVTQLIWSRCYIRHFFVLAKHPWIHFLEKNPVNAVTTLIWSRPQGLLAYEDQLPVPCTLEQEIQEQIGQEKSAGQSSNNLALLSL